MQWKAQGKKKQYREDLEKIHKAGKLMKNQYEDFEDELDKLLQMSRVQPLGNVDGKYSRKGTIS